MIYYMVRRFRIQLKSCYFIFLFFIFYFTAESFKETHFETLNVVMLLKLATVGPSGLSIIGVL